LFWLRLKVEAEILRLTNLKNRIYLPSNAWVLALSATVWTIGGSMVNPYQSLFFFAVGADSVFIGFLMALSSAVTALMQLIGGYVADKWGRRKIIVVFSIISAATAFVYIFINQYQLLIIPMLLAGIAGIYGPAFNAMLTDSMKPELRARGIASFTLITSLPTMFCPFIGGMLMSRFGISVGLRIGYFISGLFGLIAVSYRALTLKETHHRAKTEEPKGMLRFMSDFAHDNASILRHASEGVKKLLAYSILVSIGTGMSVPYTSLYVVGALAIQPDLYGLITNLTGVISVILLLPAAHIVERIGLRKSVIYASLSVPVNQLIFVRANGMDDLVAWGVIGSTSNVLLGPSLTALQANLSTQETRGRIMAMFSVFSLITAIPSQILGGYLYSSLGPYTPFLASVPMFVFATLVLTRIKETSVANN
jgi:DHA1 family tetracycline resistance protein-like MFS transporter